MKSNFFLLTLLFPLLATAQIDHWESILLPGDQWQYLVPEAQPSAAWTQVGFNDDNWQTGPSGFGFGDQDDDTELPEETISVYLRKEFHVAAIEEIEALYLDMDFDDGFVAYLNGEEAARAFMNGSPPVYNAFSSGLHEALLYQNQHPDRYKLNKDFLINGTNVLAMQVHNENAASSDLSAIPVLSVAVNTPSSRYREVPDWFQTPSTLVFSSSNLPIVVLETNGSAEIPNEPKIRARMKIISRANGERNYLTDQEDPEHLNYSGRIRIEVRGSSSSILPKKQYGFTTYNAADSQKEDVSLLDMPEENDWILNGLAFDPSLIRDYLSYNLYRKMGNYATRTQYCEVVLNGTYQGLYILQEKVKDDDNRVDINEIGPEDNELPQLTGGYIIKSDKIENGEISAWTMSNQIGWYADFIHVTPEITEVTQDQHEYIKGVFTQLETTSASGNASLASGYPAVIDIPSFIDFMLINELSANVDAYQFSTYYHKDRNGKLRAGPIWDHNLSFGNDLFTWGFDRSHTNVWQFDNGDNVGARFWKDLYDHTTFRCYMARRWQELMQPGALFHPNSLNAYIDEVVAEISEAVVREEDRWRTVGDHGTQITAMKYWTAARINWMTSQLTSTSGCTNVSVPSLTITGIHYQPEPQGDTESSALEFLELTNTGDAPIDLTGVYIAGTGLVYQFPVNTGLNAGSKVILANESDDFRKAYGFTPFDEFSRSLNNAGQAIRFLDAFGNVVDEVAYSPEAPWPTEAAGAGSYLALIDPLADNNDPANWRTAAPEELEWVLGADRLEPVVTLYPNPAEDVVRIAAAGTITSLVLHDLQGKELIVVSPQAAHFELDLRALPKGLYLVRIVTDRGEFVRKVRRE